MPTAELVFPKSGGDPLYASEVNQYFRMADLGSTALSATGSLLEIGTLTTGSFNTIKFKVDAIGSISTLSGLMLLMLDGRSGTNNYDSVLIENGISITANAQFISCGWFASSNDAGSSRDIFIEGTINNNNTWYLPGKGSGANVVIGNMYGGRGKSVLSQFAGNQFQAGSTSINRISFVGSGGTFMSGTRMQLWGIR